MGWRLRELYRKPVDHVKPAAYHGPLQSLSEGRILPQESSG